MSDCKHNVTHTAVLVKMGGSVTEKACVACKAVLSQSFEPWKQTPAPLEALAEKVDRIERTLAHLMEQECCEGQHLGRCDIANEWKGKPNA